jgi:hypothetical protein
MKKNMNFRKRHPYHMVTPSPWPYWIGHFSFITYCWRRSLYARFSGRRFSVSFRFILSFLRVLFVG